MTSNTPESGLEELSVDACWAFLRAQSVGRLAVWVVDHPDIFPLNYVIDHGTLVFRSRRGTKLMAALSEAPVALEIDGFESDSSKAWSVVVKGHAKEISEVQEVLGTMDLPLFPWQAGEKNHFVRIIPDVVTGRRFPVAAASAWRSPLSDMRHSSVE